VTITLSPDGKRLTYEYSEAPEPGFERFFHYVISLQSRPKLITGRSPYSVETEQEVDYSEIPSYIVHDVRHWLESNLFVATGRQETSLATLLSQYLALLSG